MKAFVQKVLEKYPSFLREKAQFERHLEMRENKEMRDALAMLKIKLGVVESWFILLNVDERFALRQALQFDQRNAVAVGGFQQGVVDGLIELAEQEY